MLFLTKKIETILCLGLLTSGASALVFYTPPVFADLYDDVEDIDKPKVQATDTPKANPAQPSPKPGAESGKGKKSTEPDQPAPGNSATTPGKEPSSGQTNTGAPQRNGPNSDKREPVFFESMGLQGLRSQGLIHLLDKVVVTQGDMRMEADKAVVHFDQKTEEVQRVVASGNVKLFRTDPETKQKVRAESNEIVFHNIERTLTLKGNARLWRGGDLVKGKQIVYELETGWIKADRVEGVVQPGGTEEGPAPGSKPAAKPSSPFSPKAPKKSTTKPSGKGG